VSGTQYTVSHIPTCDELLARAMHEVQRKDAEIERLRAEVESLTGLLATFDHVPTLRPTAGAVLSGHAAECAHLHTRPTAVDDPRPLCVACGAVYDRTGWMQAWTGFSVGTSSDE
jgi:hypothetical protein